MDNKSLNKFGVHNGKVYWFGGHCLPNFANECLDTTDYLWYGTDGRIPTLDGDCHVDFLPESDATAEWRAYIISFIENRMKNDASLLSQLKSPVKRKEHDE
jgi:hypothetical protein